MVSENNIVRVMKWRSIQSETDEAEARGHCRKVYERKLSFLHNTALKFEHLEKSERHGLLSGVEQRAKSPPSPATTANEFQIPQCPHFPGWQRPVERPHNGA
jgi:hypothetical protein